MLRSPAGLSCSDSLSRSSSALCLVLVATVTSRNKETNPRSHWLAEVTNLGLHDQTAAQVDHSEARVVAQYNQDSSAKAEHLSRAEFRRVGASCLDVELHHWAVKHLDTKSSEE